MANESKKCVFAGTFDPPTLGHKALIDDCLKLFDEVVVAIMVNPQKQPCFTLEQREKMLALTVENNPRVRIVNTEGTVAELLKAEGTKIYVRGIRNSIDLDMKTQTFMQAKSWMGI